MTQLRRYSLKTARLLQDCKSGAVDLRDILRVQLINWSEHLNIYAVNIRKLVSMTGHPTV